MTVSLPPVKVTAMPPFSWQRDFWQTFCDSVTRERLPHALLLCGIEGIGIGSLAHAMARYVLCQARLEDLACGRCQACTLYQTDAHPDLTVLRKEEGASQLKVDQIRYCVERVTKTAHFDGHKVIVIEDADTMNVNAANALLKSLEEPSANTLFILVTTRASAILPTIRSRCQKKLLPVPMRQESLSWLQAQSVQEAEYWLDLTGGAPLLAKQWAEGGFAEQRAAVIHTLEGFFDYSTQTLQAAEAWSKLDVGTFMHLQLTIVDSLLKAKLASVAADQNLARLIDMFMPLPADMLFKVREKFQDIIKKTHQNTNLNQQMLCEEVAMGWHALANMALRA